MKKSTYTPVEELALDQKFSMVKEELITKLGFIAHESGVIRYYTKARPTWTPKIYVYPSDNYGIIIIYNDPIDGEQSIYEMPWGGSTVKVIKILNEKMKQDWQ